MATDISGVFVSIERLKLLEKYEAEYIAQENKKKDILNILNKARKEHPEKHAKKVLENYHKNKDEINAKKRAQYAAKKAAMAIESKNTIV